MGTRSRQAPSTHSTKPKCKIKPYSLFHQLIHRPQWLYHLLQTFVYVRWTSNLVSLGLRRQFTRPDYTFPGGRFERVSNLSLIIHGYLFPKENSP